MPDIEHLNPRQHGDWRIDSQAAMDFIAGLQAVPLRATELSQAACCFPLFLSKEADTGHWALSGLTGLEPQSNLFVQEGRWQAVYRPNFVATYPLVLAPNPEGGTRLVSALNPASAGVNRERGEPLFDAQGRVSDWLEAQERQLQTDISAALPTHELIQALDRLQLIKPLEVNIRYADGSSRVLEGLASLDQDALSALPASEVADLHARGFLLAAHALLMSLFQVNQLIQRHNQRHPERAVQKLKLQS